MGVCTYKGGTLPAGSRGMCTDYGGTWTEDEVGVKKEGFMDSLIGDDFASAVSNWDGSDESTEGMQGYLTRRWEEDPAKLAWDIGSWGVGGGVGLKVASKLGLGKLLKNTFSKTKTKTKFKKPEIDPVTKKIKKGTKFGEVTTTSTVPRILPSAVMGTAGYQADKLGMLPFVPGGAFSQEGKDAQYQRRLDTLKDTVAGLDAKDDAAKQKANAEKIAAEEAKVAQDKIDNMSFFDKWKLGMKDPRTAALFGAGLRDIGSNIPGQNQLGAMQVDLADADAAMTAANKPNAALHNVTKVSNKELMTRFTDKKTFLIGNKEEEERKATYKLGMYRALESALLKANLPADDVTIMKLLEEDSKKA